MTCRVAKRLTLAALAIGLAACSSSSNGNGGSGGSVGSGGNTTTGGSTGSGGSPATGGTTGTGGRDTSTGGSPATGGISGTGGGAGGTAGAAGNKGGAGAGGHAGGGGAHPNGGAVGTGGNTTTPDGGVGAPVPSAGCGKAPTLKNSPGTTANYNMLTVNGKTRQYILRYPDNYDSSHPYRFIIAYHWLSGSASQVFNCQTESIKCYTTQSPFYGLWNLANNSTIFVAPDGLNAGWGNAGGEDVTFTDQIVKAVEDDLCIDKSRLFANGFSYGGGMSKAIGCARADVFRGIAVYSGADFLSGCDGGKSPIAFYGSHATDDPTNQYSSGITILNRFVANNGCTMQTVPTPPSGGHTCIQFAGCSEGHPTRFCAFQGSNRHDPSPRDPGQSTSWNPPEVWKFITQF
ncbi:MAG: hypothetical protein ABUS79_26735 [Pseudomonadota bacterium]